MTNVVPVKFLDILNRVVKGQITSYNVEIVEGKLKGENFLGDIIFITLQNKTTSEYTHLVVKQAIENLSKAGLFSTVYPREIYFYEHIWPTLNKFQESRSLKFNKVPKCFTICKTPREEQIVMEDLYKQHFRIFDKTKTLDRSHLELMFKSYGTFHAISVAFKEEHPEQFKEIYDTLSSIEVNIEGTKQEQEFKTNVRNNIDYVQSLFDESKDKGIVSALEEYKKNAYSSFEDIGRYADTTMLVHGDSWNNNMMFQYDETGLVKDMRFLDFQLIAIGTPVKDLAYCFYTSAPKDIQDELDDFLLIYINSFSEALKILNCHPKKPYTLKKLKSEWKRFGKFGYLMGLLLWRLKLVDKKHIPKVEDNSISSLSPISEQHKDNFHKLMKDLTIHFYKNDFF